MFDSIFQWLVPLVLLAVAVLAVLFAAFTGFAEGLVRVVDAVNEGVGRAVSWLTLGTVLVCFVVVVLRYAFSIGWVWMQDIYVWFHAGVFMLGAGYTLKAGGHVRVDLIYARLSDRRRAWVDIFGSFVLMTPYLVVMGTTSLPFTLSSWSILEHSLQPDGLPGFFIIKSVLVLYVLLLAIQALALLARSVLVLRGLTGYAPAAMSH